MNENKVFIFSHMAEISRPCGNAIYMAFYPKGDSFANRFNTDGAYFLTFDCKSQELSAGDKFPIANGEIIPITSTVVPRIHTQIMVSIYQTWEQNVNTVAGDIYRIMHHANAVDNATLVYDSLANPDLDDQIIAFASKITDSFGLVYEDGKDVFDPEVETPRAINPRIPVDKSADTTKE